MHSVSSLLYFSFAHDKQSRQRYVTLNASCSPQKALRRLYSAIETDTLSETDRQALIATGVVPSTIDKAVRYSNEHRHSLAARLFHPHLRPVFALAPPGERKSYVPTMFRGAVHERLSAKLPDDIAQRPWLAQLDIVYERMRSLSGVFEREVSAPAKQAYFGTLLAFDYLPAPLTSHRLNLREAFDGER